MYSAIESGDTEVLNRRVFQCCLKVQLLLTHYTLYVKKWKERVKKNCHIALTTVVNLTYLTVTFFISSGSFPLPLSRALRRSVINFSLTYFLQYTDRNSCHIQGSPCILVPFGTTNMLLYKHKYTEYITNSKFIISSRQFKLRPNTEVVQGLWVGPLLLSPLYKPLQSVEINISLNTQIIGHFGTTLFRQSLGCGTDKANLQHSRWTHETQK